MRTIFTTLFIFLILKFELSSQFSVDEYNKFKEQNKNMEYQQLLNMYPAGKFYDSYPTKIEKSEFGTDLISKLKLTQDEQNIVNKNGICVSQRFKYNNFIAAFDDIYTKDLPVYISTDALLNPIHFSFDKILKNIEASTLIDSLIMISNKSILLHYDFDWKKVDNNDKNDKILYDAARDAILFFGVPNEILRTGYKDYFSVYRNVSVDYSPLLYKDTLMKNQIINLISLINSKKAINTNLFSSKDRMIDFSQFTPRGHYLDDIKEEDVSITNRSLAYNLYNFIPYFQAMMWYGRTEMTISNAENTVDGLDSIDLQRQLVMSCIVNLTIQKYGLESTVNGITQFTNSIIGESDNISFFDIKGILNKYSVTFESIYTDLVNPNLLAQIRNDLLKLKNAKTKYNSQLIMSNDSAPSVPASSFLLFGQAATIDSYIMSKVVYSQISYKDTIIHRLFPKTLDVLFALGNDASIQLLEPEIEKYKYSSNLAGLRYLIEGYDSSFWQQSVYTNWLYAIKSLIPPNESEREKLPTFMQTSAFWQKQMTTQLASWSELRHDFILYAKQSYSDMPSCIYPKVYLEPNKTFYKNCINIFKCFKKLAINNSEIIAFSNNAINTYQTLDQISEQMINNKELTSSENTFLQSLLFSNLGPNGCAKEEIYSGWYIKLFFHVPTTRRTINYSGNSSNIVADVHTVPADADGKLVGWVLHSGTGPVNLAIITDKCSDGQTWSYAGPVYSYYEYVTKDFKRLNDNEWSAQFQSNVFGQRPDFSKNYLADSVGKPYSNPSTLFLKENLNEVKTNNEIQFTTNIYPNPISKYCDINLVIPNEVSNQNLSLEVFDINGNLIKKLVNENLPNNNYIIRWNLEDLKNKIINNGVYLVKAKIGNYENTLKIVKE